MGYTTHTCTRCSDTYIDSYVNALGHTAGAKADCLNDQICTVCGAVLTEKLGHDYKTVVIVPICTEQGYTTHTCTRCADTYTDSEVAAPGHTAGAAADCLNDQTCTVCGEVLTGKLGHDYEAVVTAPTCTEKGYTTHSCTRCADTYVDSETVALGHTPGDWIVDTEPAPGVEGSQHKECTACGETLETGVIEALPVETESETIPAEGESDTAADTTAETEKASEKNGCSGSIYSCTSLMLLILALMPLMVKRKKETE